MMFNLKKKILISVGVLLIFTLGLLTERFQIDNKFKDLLKNSYDKHF